MVLKEDALGLVISSWLRELAEVLCVIQHRANDAGRELVIVGANCVDASGPSELQFYCNSTEKVRGG